MNGNYFNNPIKLLHRLKEAGFTEKQAEVQVEIMNDYLEHGLVTKKDLRELELKIDSRFKEFELRLTVKTAAIVGSIVGFFSILEKIIK